MEIDKKKEEPRVKEREKDSAPTTAEKDGPTGPVKPPKEKKRSKEKLEKVRKKCAQKEKMRSRREDILKKRKGVITMEELDNMVSHAKIYPSAYFSFKTTAATAKPIQQVKPAVDMTEPHDCILRLQITRTLLEKISDSPDLTKCVRGLYINTITKGLLRILSHPSSGTVSALNIDGTSVVVPYSDISDIRPTVADVTKFIEAAQLCNGAVPTNHMVIHTLNHCRIKDLLPGVPDSSKQESDVKKVDDTLAEHLKLFKDLLLRKDKLSQMLRTKNRHDFECLSRNRFVITRSGLQLVRGMNPTADGVMVSNMQEGGAIDVKYISIVNREVTIPDMESYLATARKHSGFIPTSSDLSRLSEKRKPEETETTSNTDPTAILESYFSEAVLKKTDVQQILGGISREEFKSRLSKSHGGMFVKKQLPSSALNTVFYIVGFYKDPSPYILCMRPPQKLRISFSQIDEKDMKSITARTTTRGVDKSFAGKSISMIEEIYTLIDVIKYKLSTSTNDEELLALCKNDKSGKLSCVPVSEVLQKEGFLTAENLQNFTAEQQGNKLIKRQQTITVLSIDFDNEVVNIESGSTKEYSAIPCKTISNNSPTPEEVQFFMSAARKAGIPLPRMQSLSSLLLSGDQIAAYMERESLTQQAFRKETIGMYIKQQSRTDEFSTIYSVVGMSTDGQHLEVENVYSDPIQLQAVNTTPEPESDLRSNSPAAMPSFVIQLKKEVVLSKINLRVSDISDEPPLCQELQRYVHAAEKVEKPIPNADDMRSIKIQKSENKKDISWKDITEPFYSTDVVAALAGVVAATRGGIPWNHVSQSVKQTVLGLARSERQEEWDVVTKELRVKIGIKKERRLELASVEKTLTESRRQAEEVSRDTERAVETFDKSIFEAERTFTIYEGRIKALEDKLPSLYSDQQEEINLRKSDVTKMEETLDTCDDELKTAEDRSLQLKEICDTYHDNITKSQQQLLAVDDKIKHHFDLQFRLAKKLLEMEVEIFKMENK